MVRYVSPGFRTVLGNADWFGESGSNCGAKDVTEVGSAAKVAVINKAPRPITAAVLNRRIFQMKKERETRVLHSHRKTELFIKK